MPELAKTIRVEREGVADCRLLVDGKEFPWYIGPSVTTTIDRSEGPGITLTLLADRVEVVDSNYPVGE